MTEGSLPNSHVRVSASATGSVAPTPNEHSAPLYVEFAGLPGAGKTTVLRELLPRLSARGYRCIVGEQARLTEAAPGASVMRADMAGKRRSGPVRTSAGDWLRLVRLGIAAYRHVFSTPPVNRRRLSAAAKLVRVVRNIARARTAARADRADMIIFGQGAISYLRQIASSTEAGRTSALREIGLCMHGFMADARMVVVLVEVDVATAVARIERRADRLGPYDRMDIEERQRQLAVQHPQIERVLAALAASDVVHGVFRMDGRQPPDVIADAVVEHLFACQPHAVSPARPSAALVDEKRRHEKGRV